MVFWSFTTQPLFLCCSWTGKHSLSGRQPACEPVKTLQAGIAGKWWPLIKENGQLAACTLMSFSIGNETVRIDWGPLHDYHKCTSVIMTLHNIHSLLAVSMLYDCLLYMLCPLLDFSRLLLLTMFHDRSFSGYPTSSLWLLTLYSNGGGGRD